MSVHVCKQCGSRFEYCRQCVFRPVRYKDAGYCSKECYEASKNPIVKPEVSNEVVLVEEPDTIVEEVQAVEDKLTVEAEVEIEVIASVELPVVDTAVAVETAPKKETYNAYNKKKKKHR